MAFKVILHARARLDIAGAVKWFAKTNPLATARWRLGFLQIVKNLETNPARYPVAEEAADLGVDLRELSFGRRRNVYRILFTIDGKTVNVLRVRHAAQDRLTSNDI